MDYDEVELEDDWLSGSPSGDLTQALTVDMEYGSIDPVLPKIKELLSAIRKLSPEFLASGSNINSSIPVWFVEFCKPPLSPEEMKSWLKHWRSLKGQEQVNFEEEKGWSLADWLYWMHPENRAWYVTGGSELGGFGGKIILAVKNWPAPLGSAKWMLQAAGATAIKVVT
jgi:hypothetical protein